MDCEWLLLAEDDRLFATLFARFWKEEFAHIPLVQVSRVADAREELAKRRAPLAAVLDLNLTDGDTLELSRELTCPCLVWSACSDGEVKKKPNGRHELSCAVRSIAEKAGVVPSQ